MAITPHGNPPAHSTGGFSQGFSFVFELLTRKGRTVFPIQAD